MDLIVPPALDGERADRVVSLVTGLARSEAAALVADGRVTRNGHQITARTVRVCAGDEMGMDVPARSQDQGPAPDPRVSFAVVFNDDAVVVVDKPAGLVVHPGSGNPDRTLVNGLLARFPDLAGQPWPDRTRPGIVHRLDKGTSGLLVVARDIPAMVSLSAQLGVHSVERRYLALAWGSVEAPAGVIDAPVGRSTRDRTRMAVRVDGRTAVTRYEVLRRFLWPAPATLLACRLETGRTHQIRVHLAAIGHPLVGDGRYRGRDAPARPATLQLPAGRPFLHADELAFDHPATADRRRFSAPLPADLEALLAAMT